MQNQNIYVRVASVQTNHTQQIIINFQKNSFWAVRVKIKFNIFAQNISSSQMSHWEPKI